ncbi:DUF418 domain-containing protein [Psychrosphaera haliotis]|nr:DUF418 domain-containing protein [Psychrosphaera haliotis]
MESQNTSPSKNPTDTSTSEISELAPIKTSQRITVMDLLRGFALIGILLMNIEWFNRPISELLSFDFTETGSNFASSWLVMVFVQGKFYKLFALLFGMGFAVMLLRAEEVGRPFKAWFSRRMLVLYIIGLAHMAFFWGGDILHDYAVAGMMLLGVVLLMRTKRLAKRNRPAVFAKVGFFMMIFPLSISILVGTIFGATSDQNDLKEMWVEEVQVADVANRMLELAKADGSFELSKQQYEELTKFDEEMVAVDEGEVTNSDAVNNIESDLMLDSEVQTQESDIEVNSLKQQGDDSAKVAGDDGSSELTADEKALNKFEGKQKQAYRYEREKEALKNESYWEITKYRWEYAVKNLPNSLFFGLGIILPLFLVGYWLVASGRMRNIDEHHSFFKVMAVGGMSLGIVLSVGPAMILMHPAGQDSMVINSVANSMFYIGQLVLCAGYLGTFALLSLKPRFQMWFGWLSPLGKMALTNYIMHSVILSTIFYGYGFNQFGEIPRSEQMLMVVAIIAAQAVVSSLWLKVFNYGPLEWLWRCATYMKLQPLRKTA